MRRHRLRVRFHKAVPHSPSLPHTHFRHQLQAQVVTCASYQPSTDWRFSQALTELQTPGVVPDCYADLEAVNQRFPRPPLLGQLTELRKPSYLLDHQFIIKAYNSGSARGKRCTGWGSMSSSGAPLAQHLHVSPQPRKFPNPVLSGFMGASLHSRGWLNHWLWKTNSDSCPSPLPREVWGWDWRSSPLITCFVPLATSSHP